MFSEPANLIPLSLQALESGKIPKTLNIPKYTRKDLSPGILHFGVGNFHRAHQGMFLHQLFQKGKDLDWAVVGAGVRPGEMSQYDKLRKQDFLSTVVEQSATSETATVIGCMVEYVEPAKYEVILERLVKPDIRIVSLTVTEGGYFLTDTRDFDSGHPEVQRDAVGNSTPKTVFGLLVAALKERRQKGIHPFTIMSCDNIPHNGAVAMNAVCSLAELSDPELSGWIKDNVSFPNSMIDRITPATGRRELSHIKDVYRLDDKVPVFCEDFGQWVVEDKFCAGRPRFEDVGVTFVSDVLKFETMKLRILNGGHASIAYPSALMGIEYVHEAMGNHLIKEFLLKVEIDEIIPTISDSSVSELQDYFSVISIRFSNPKIGDTVRRLCLDGSHRQPQFILPTLADRLANGQSVEGLALVSALWCRYCYGMDESGRLIEPNDPCWKTLTLTAKSARDDPMKWLLQKPIYGDLAESTPFAMAFKYWLRKVWDKGTKNTIQAFLRGKKSA
ncbi:unnamed protein product [Agarophyton chilense]